MQTDVGQSLETTTPVIDFAAPAPKPRCRRQLPSHPDATLIDVCVRGAIALAGSSGAFDVDPTEDCEFAQPLDDNFLTKGRAAADFLAQTQVKTFDGLKSKAAFLALALRHLDGDDCEDALISLSDDIARFHKASTTPTSAVIAP